MLVEDVKKFGPLPFISSYPFENTLGYVKRMVRHGNLPLSQVSKRLTEISDLIITNIKNENNAIFVSNQIKTQHQNFLTTTSINGFIYPKNLYCLLMIKIGDF